MKNSMTQFSHRETYCLEFCLPMLGTADIKFFLTFARFFSQLRKSGKVGREDLAQFSDKTGKILKDVNCCSAPEINQQGRRN